MAWMNGLILPRLAWSFLPIRRVTYEKRRSSVYRVGIRVIDGFNERFNLASMAASSDNSHSADFKKFHDRETGRLSSLNSRPA
jgi:hypothetical protein